MVTNYILSIDPGVSTGIALIGYEPDSSPVLMAAWQFTGGALTLRNWINYRFNWSEDHGSFFAYGNSPQFQSLRVPEPWRLPREDLTVIAEKFTPRALKGFSYTTETLEPLRGEGVLIGLEEMPDYTPKEKRWRTPALQYLVGGKDLADKKKRQHAFLKDSGFYRTNKDFPDSPSKDGADDFRSAAAHGLNYLAREVKHAPTFRLITEWSSS